MTNNLPFNSKPSFSRKDRRSFLKYLVGSATGAIAIGLMFPSTSESLEATLEQLCSAFPLNSRCKDYLPGVRATDNQGKPIDADTLLATAKPGLPVMVEGSPQAEPTYLVIEQGPKIATYAIKPVCTHLGCTVQWQTEQNRFVCPCHGSQYDAQGRVLHGPAKRSLPLKTVVVKQNQIRLVEHTPAIDPR